MVGCDAFFEKLHKTLPDLASSKDLVKAGIYGSIQAAYSARKMGKCPTYLRIPGRGIVYPRENVILYFRDHVKQNA